MQPARNKRTPRGQPRHARLHNGKARPADNNHSHNSQVAWRRAKDGKVTLGMDLTEIKPIEGYAGLLAALAKRAR